VSTPAPPGPPSLPDPDKPPDPLALLRSRSYIVLLVIAVIIGAPVSTAAYFFLALVSKLQGWIFTDLPKGLGFHAEPLWWPILPLLVAGVLVALTIKYLPGTGGHSPADGFKAGAGAPSPRDLPGIVLAAFATLSLGVVLGPEAPLIALGGGLGVLAVKLVKRDAPARTQAVVAAAGSFAAISTLLGSPLTGAFLLMEASGLGGEMLQVVLVPGLLAAGVGSLVFVGLDAWTGLGTFSLAIPGLPHVGAPTIGEFLWALGIGVLAVPFGMGIRWLGLFLRPYVERRMVLLTPVVGLAVAGLAIAFAAGTGKGSSEVLFSGQSALGPFVDHAASYSIGAVVLLLVCKGIAYGISLSSFRGGPTFPALFLGAAGGVALSHLPGLPLVDGVAMGIAAMSVVMLRLPLTSVLLASLLLASDGLAVMPLVIVSVAVAYVLSARLTPSPAAGPAAEGPRPAVGPTAAAAGAALASPTPANPVPAGSDGRPEFPASSPPR
jgi:H+/Cl- antiporter ClcA